MSSPSPTSAHGPSLEARGLTSPFFELGPKNLLRLPEIIDVGAAAQIAGERWGVSVILTVPTPLISPVQAALPGILVFAQNMDGDELGPSVGRVIAESLMDAGARGVMLNHDSHPLAPDELGRCVERANSLGLLSVVCAGSETEVLEVAKLHPSVILFEPPELIGDSGGAERPWIHGIDERVRTAAPEVLMMHAGGVGAPEDAYRIMRSGAAGTGSTSGVLRDPSPTDAVAAFIQAVREGFDDHRAP